MVFGFFDKIVVPKRTNEVLRFGILVVSMFSALCTGALYSFSLISNKMQNDYGFSPNDLTTISTVGIVIGYFTLPFGFVFDYFGPKPIFVIGVVTYVIGALLFALTFGNVIGHSVASLSVINAVMNIGCAQFDMGSILTAMSWFPLDRGLLVATCKTMVGLGSSVISTLYTAFFPEMYTEYMYFLIGLVVVVGVICFVVIHLPPYHMTGWRMRRYTEEDRELAARYEHIYLTYKASRPRFYIAFFLVISLLITITVQNIVFVFIDSSAEKRRPPAIVMIVLFVLLVAACMPFSFLDRGVHAEKSALELVAEEQDGEDVDDDDVANVERLEVNKANDSQNDSDAEAGMDKLPDAAEPICVAENSPVQADDSNDATGTPPRTLTHEEDRNFPQFQTGFFRNILRPELFCTWINALGVSGGVHIVLLNTAQIYYAVSGSPEDTTRSNLYVSLTSVGNAVARLAVSLFEAYNQGKPLEKRVPITVTYCIPSVLLCVASILFQFVPASALLVPFILSGMANGGYAASLVLSVRTMFSIDVAKHYNSIFFFDLIAVIVFNRFLFGEIMTKNSVQLPEFGDNIYCLDRAKCIRVPFIVIACMCAVSFAASLFMHIHYSRWARQRMAERAAELQRIAQGGEAERIEDEELAEKSELSA